MVGVLVQAPWISVGRSRFRFDIFSRAWSPLQLKHRFSVSFHLTQDTPAMEALRRHPYPSTPPDPSVFEDFSEYSDVHTHGDFAAPESSNQTLLDLVKNRHYDVADRVRAELVEMGEEIFPDPIFAMAALHALKKPNPQRRDRLPEFTSWFSLVPNKLPEEKCRTFYRIHLQLFKHQKSDYLPIVMRFGTLCASKGHIDHVASQAISFVVRFAQPAVSTAFLDEFERGAVKYLEQVDPKIVKTKLNHFWGLAIRTHCLSGRLDEAVEMLEATRARNIGVSTKTYDLLLQKLTVPEHIEVVKDLYKTSGSYIHRTLGSKSIIDSPKQTSVEDQERTEDYEATAELDLKTELSPITVIARNLLYLRKTLNSPTPPSASHLVNFFHAYRSTGRTRGLVLLYRKAFFGKNQSNSAKILWLRAEMLLYLHFKMYRLVIYTFATHFYLVGVPEEVVALEMRRLRAQKQKKVGMRRKLKEATVVPWLAMNKKLWPTSWITALVWQALVSLWAEGQTEVAELYQHLIEMVRSNQADNALVTAPSFADSPSHQPRPKLAPPPIQSVTQAHFNSFIHHYVKWSHNDRPTVPPHPDYARTCQHLRNATTILNDMVSLGIPPNVYTLSTLIRGFAYAGDASRAWSVLEKMDEDSSNSDITSPLSFPAPTIVIYTSLIQGFVEAQDLENGLKAEARMRVKLKYVPGSNGRMETVLKRLRRMEARLKEQEQFQVMESVPGVFAISCMHKGGLNWKLTYNYLFRISRKSLSGASGYADRYRASWQHC